MVVAIVQQAAQRCALSALGRSVDNALEQDSAEMWKISENDARR
jgi:hypothetical protein